MNFLLITSNLHKHAEVERVLGHSVDHINLELDELQELDTEKIADHKAKQAFSLVQKPLVTWDQSVFIDCLNRFPGPLIKWFWEQVTLEKICEIAQFYKNPRIETQTLLTYYDGTTMKHFSSVVKGTIPETPMGTSGFGWDPIFIPAGSTRTYAQMELTDELFHSVDKAAILALKAFLSI